MLNAKILSFLIVLILIVSCSKEEKKISTLKETDQNLEMVRAYKEGFKALKDNDTFFAAQKFLEAELLFPQSEWAPKASLMASYSYYLQNYFSESLSNLERYLKTYPNHENVSYAHYLIAMCYYETIEDEKRDTAPLIRAQKKFKFILKKYPESDFALDSKFKLDLIENILASKEIYLGRHYMKKKKWIASINRFKKVIEQYDKTVFVEEALHRLVEINYKIGLTNESEKYANVLGYNYGSGQWYKKSYKVFNKNYDENINKVLKKEKKGVISIFKKLFQ